MSPENFQKSGKNGTNLHTKSIANSTNHAKDIQSAIPSIKRLTLRAEPTEINDHLPETSGSNKNSGTVFGRRGCSSWSGNSNGSAIREARGRGDNQRPNFNLDVPSNGYAWWYVDGLSYDCLLYTSPSPRDRG